MNIFQRILLLIVLVAWSGQMLAQEEPVPDVFSDDLMLTEANQLHPFGVFTLDLPFYIGSFKEKGSRFSLGYSMANVWHPQSTVYYPQMMTEAQRRDVNELYITQRPYYFFVNDIPVEKKTFSTDGVLQELSFTYLWQLARKGSFIFKLNANYLAGGSFPLHYLASDHFIEWFHTTVGLEDNFGRKQFPFDRAHIEYEDENGKKIRIDKGDSFLSTFDINYYRPLLRTEWRTGWFSMQAGAHFSLPLNDYYPKAAGGFSTSFLLRKKVTPRFYVDLGGDFSVLDNSLIRFGDAINMIDRELRKSGKTYLSFDFESKKKRVFAFGLVNSYQDAFLKGYIFSHTQDQYKDLGVRYLQKGDMWEGMAVNEPFRLSKLTAASMYFFSIESFIFIEFRGPKSNFAFHVGEDHLVVNNAPDIQYSFQYTRKFGK